MFKKNIILIFPLFFLSVLNAQTGVRLSGMVMDSNRNSLMGATITAIRNHVTVINNKNGFTLKLILLPDTLVVSQVGYSVKTVNIVQPSDTINIVLNAAENALNDVMVNTGYFSVPKERATGSFTFIDNKTLNEQVGTNILNRLNGVASGVLFDDNKATDDNKKLDLTVRGLSSINGPKDPLIVVDNFPYDGDINNINPNDIESITILKDAAAASIWGTMAGNGVIVITTKKSGFNRKTQLNFSGTVTMQDKPNLYYLPQMSSSDYINVEQMLFNAGAYDYKIGGINQPALSPAVEIFIQKKEGLISAQDSATAIDKLKKQDIRSDLDRYFYRKPVTQQYNVTATGSSNNIAWLLSGSFDHAISNLDAVYRKINIHLANTYRPVKNLSVKLNLLYTNSRSLGGRPGYGDITIGGAQVPYLKLVDEEEKALPIAKTYRQNYIDTAGDGLLLDWNYYPLTDYRHDRPVTSLEDINANINLHYNLSRDLEADIIWQYEKQRSDMQTDADLESYYTRDLINTFSQIDRTSSMIKYKVPKGSILQSDENTIYINNARGQLSYDGIWKNGRLSVIAGAEIREKKSASNSNTVYGYDKDILTTANVDFANAYPTFVTGSPAYIPNGIALSEYLNRFVSLYGNGAYTYLEKYTLSGSIRRDASNLFGVKTNDRWTPLWSIGMAWKISKEKFYKFRFVDYLNVRLSYGFSGNVDQSMSALTTLNTVGANSYTGFPYAFVTNYYNPDLKWEKVATFNVGVDFQVKHNIATGTVEYYHKKGSDLFGLVPIDYTVGLGKGTIVKNAADMAGNGVDIQLNTQNLKGAIGWNTELLFSYNLSKTTKYYQGASTWAGIIGDGSSISPVVGKPLYAIASYKWARLDPENGNPRGYLNGQVSEDYDNIIYSPTSADSLKYDGSATPKYFGTLANIFRWKGFALNILIAYKFGYYFRRTTISYSSLYDNGNGHSDYAKRWQKPGDEQFTTVPSSVYPDNYSRDQFYQLSEATVDPADNIRLQFINFSWQVDKKPRSKLPFKSLRLFINLSNMGIIWRANKDHLDPDYPSVLPPVKTYAIGFTADL